jgi:hypothetical protein
MADVKISQLPPAGQPIDGDQSVTVRGGVTMRYDGRLDSLAVSTSIPNYVGIENVGEFLVALATLTKEVCVVFGRKGMTSGGTFLRLGEVKDGRWVSPDTAFISSITISREDIDSVDIEIVINGIVEETVNTSALNVLHAVNVPVGPLDTVQIRTAAGGNDIEEVACSLILKSALSVI